MYYFSQLKVCGIVGSPNKNGNVDLLVSQVLKGAGSQGAEIQKLYLNDMAIQPCQDCGVDPFPNYCLFEDDMALVYATLESWDIIVLGSPVYFDTVSTQTKLAIDRCNCLAPFVKQPDGTWIVERRIEKRKKGVFIAVAGSPDQGFDTMLVTVKAFFDWANIELVETILHANPDNELGNVKQDDARMAQAFQVGLDIVRGDEAKGEGIECITLDGHKKMIQRDSLVLRPAVYAIIVHDDKVLLIKMRHSGKYHPPGGGVSVGERMADALKREIREETGIEVEIERLAHFEELFFYYDPSEIAYHGLHFYYVCHPKTLVLLDDTQVNDDAAEKPRWVSIQSLQAHHFQAHGDIILELCKETVAAR